MKKIVLILVILLLSLTIFAKEGIKNNSKIEKEDEKIYIVGKDDYTGVYTGIFIIKYENGNIEEERRYKDGLFHGELKYYYKTGQLASISIYNNGIKDGIFKYYTKDGELSHEVVWENDIKIETIYHK